MGLLRVLLLSVTISCIAILVTWSMKHVSNLDTSYYWENFSSSSYGILNMAEDIEHAATAIVYAIVGQILAVFALALTIVITFRDKK